jgi:hypothetical protein
MFAFRSPHRVFLRLALLQLTALALLACVGRPVASQPVHDGFVPLNHMQAARTGQTATRLEDGRVLIAGGTGNGPDIGGQPLRSAELFDPKMNAFVATGSMAVPRNGAVAALLPDGRVLIAGGDGGQGSAELYDPRTGRFAPTGSMLKARMDATAVTLTNGGVLVLGGAGSDVYASAEIFDPKFGVFRPTGSMTDPRSRPSATRMLDGRILVAGGRGDAGPLSETELYDPNAGVFSGVNPLPDPSDDQAALLPDGRVAVFGCSQTTSADGLSTIVAEIYDSKSHAFVESGALAVQQCGFMTTSLSDGAVLVMAGNSADVFSPIGGRFRPTSEPGGWPDDGTMTLLEDGRVLIAGGWTEDDHSPAFEGAELYLP